MERLYIPEGRANPEVILDKDQGKFLIKGVSLMENPFVFYQPIVEWVKEYSENPNEKTVFTFRLLYLNSASLVNVSRILHILRGMYRDGLDVLVRWYYDERDPSIKEHAEELQDLFGLPFEILVIN